MEWQKKGRLYAPDPNSDTMKLYGILPTPQLLPDRHAIRIFFSATGEDRIGRIFSMVVDAEDPSRIIDAPEQALLEPGKPGAFDDCGVNPCSVLRVGTRTFLYYIGYQRSVMSPYLIFTGLAISDDEGRSFSRLSNVP